MLVTIRSRESGTYVSRVEVRAVEVFCPVLETNKVKSLHVEDQGRRTTVVTFRQKTVEPLS